MIAPSDLNALLTNTASLFENIHYFECATSSIKGKSSRGAAITYADLVERRADFVNELRISICNWVFSESKFNAMLQEELAVRGHSMANASARIVELARSKFRSGFPQGQFGELLLFNFIQHFFKAAPILRKMPITTNPSVERHGADAIHVGFDAENPILYLGEAKTYSSKYKFSSAFEAAVDSIIKSHDEIHSELNLYVFDEFIEPPFIDFAKKIKRNEISLKTELVSVISYEETGSVQGADEKEIKKKMQQMVSDRLNALDPNYFSGMNPHVVSRMHFFVLPFWGLEGLLKEFEK